ncbi:MAG: competence/damage-inducible protein A [Elusimicrobia bacterium]|nr:competence/damage-inducible protein A [Candidatus Obscuribacterium magneticum]
MTRPRIELICVGTELLTGKVNTHTSAIGQRLGEIGLTLAQGRTVGDGPELMEEVFSESLQRSDVVISAGGLGPTFDDLSRDVWSKVTRRPLTFHPGLLEAIKERFRQRKIKMPPQNRRQAFLLNRADEIPNEFGTAPGQFVMVGRKLVILLPGPSRELFPMLDQYVMPRLQQLYSRQYSVHKSFHVFGLPESEVDRMIRPIVTNILKVKGCSITHSILASQLIITVRYRVDGASPATVFEAANFLEKKIRTKLGQRIYGKNGDTLEGVVGSLLRSKRKSLAVAESCTGGLVAKLITDQPGASDYFYEGVVSYSNRSKLTRLGVKSETLQRFGAVSEKVAREMAAGLKRRVGVDYALSVTGIAGPTGATPQKPIGLIYIGLAGVQRTVVKKFYFTGDRSWIRQRAALTALDLLRKELLRPQ